MIASLLSLVLLIEGLPADDPSGEIAADFVEDHCLGPTDTISAIKKLNETGWTESFKQDETTETRALVFQREGTGLIGLLLLSKDGQNLISCKIAGTQEHIRSMTFAAIRRFGTTTDDFVIPLPEHPGREIRIVKGATKLVGESPGIALSVNLQDNPNSEDTK